MRWTRQAWIVVTALVALTALTPSPARAIEYPWCAAMTGTMDGARNCGFVSLQQCQGYVHGLGGFCERNQFYTGPEKTLAPKPRKQRRD
jgi:Protein of unknown function (DUF3551)